MSSRSGVSRFKSLEACVDFCNKVDHTSSAAEVEHYLARSWQADIGISLRRVFDLLSVHQGKPCTNTALYALHWLLKEHPLTLSANLKHIVAFGCIRDLVMLLMVVRCSLAEGVTFDEWHGKKARPQKGKEHSLDHNEFYRKVRNVPLQGNALKLHQDILSLFVDALQKDMEAMRDGKGVSLFSKWLPSQDSYLNRTTRLFDDVAMHFYLRDEENTGKGDSHHRRPLIRARNHLRQVYISPLRNHADLAERLMSDGRWDQITYAQVPYKCMAKNAARFAKHDLHRYTQFACGLAEGSMTSLRPHRICFRNKRTSTMPVNVIEAQWQAYVRSMKERDKLSKAVSISDVSSSISGQPRKVAISLGFLVASLAEPLWKDRLITFGTKPRFHRINGSTLAKKMRNIQRMSQSNHTHFDAVFESILDRARQNNLNQTDMPTRLFVFSGMPFEDAFPDVESTTFNRVKTNYAAYGYEMPQIVFWNLNNSHGVGIKVTDEGTTLISGFNGDLLKLFLEDDGLTEEKLRKTPSESLRKALGYRRYNVLKVID